MHLFRNQLKSHLLVFLRTAVHRPVCDIKEDVNPTPKQEIVFLKTYSLPIIV